MEKVNITIATFEGGCMPSKTANSSIACVIGFAVDIIVFQAEKACVKCFKCRPSHLGFRIPESLPAASQMTFKNVDTLHFEMAV